MRNCALGDGEFSYVAMPTAFPWGPPQIPSHSCKGFWLKGSTPTPKGQQQLAPSLFSGPIKGRGVEQLGPEPGEHVWLETKERLEVLLPSSTDQVPAPCRDH